MTNVVLLAVAMLLPTLVGLAVLGLARLWRWVRSPDRGPVVTAPPIERIAGDVRRLNDQQDALRAAAPGPGRGLRLRALRAAYVDALGAACQALDVVPPRASGSGPPARAEISRVESELSARGLAVGRPGRP